jgi:hypothetical protein
LTATLSPGGPAFDSMTNRCGFSKWVAQLGLQGVRRYFQLRIAPVQVHTRAVARGAHRWVPQTLDGTEAAAEGTADAALGFAELACELQRAWPTTCPATRPFAAESCYQRALQPAPQQTWQLIFVCSVRAAAAPAHGRTNSRAHHHPPNLLASMRGPHAWRHLARQTSANTVPPECPGLMYNW